MTTMDFNPKQLEIATETAEKIIAVGMPPKDFALFLTTGLNHMHRANRTLKTTPDIDGQNYDDDFFEIQNVLENLALPWLGAQQSEQIEALVKGIYDISDEVSGIAFNKPFSEMIIAYGMDMAKQIVTEYWYGPFMQGIQILFILSKCLADLDGAHEQKKAA